MEVALDLLGDSGVDTTIDEQEIKSGKRITILKSSLTTL